MAGSEYLDLSSFLSNIMSKSLSFLKETPVSNGFYQLTCEVPRDILPGIGRRAVISLTELRQFLLRRELLYASFISDHPSK